MSFGLGLVKGLVGGFTRNIQQEQQARATDDQRLAALEDTLFAAALDPKKRVPQELGNMLKEAKTALEEREGIDIFGRAGPRLRLDMDKLSNIVNSTDDAKKFYQLGTYQIPINADFFDTKAVKGPERATMFFNAFQDYVTKNPSETGNLIEYLMSNNGVLARQKLSEDHKNFAGFFFKNNLIKVQSKDGFTTQLIKPDTKGRFSTFYSAFGNVLKNDRNQLNIEIDNAVDKFNQVDETTLEDTDASQGMPKNSFVFLNDANKFGIFKFDDEDKFKTLNKMAVDNGFVGKNNVSKFVEAYRVSVSKDKPEITIGDDGNVVLPNKVRNHFPLLFHAINLRQLGANKPMSEISNAEKLAMLAYTNKKGLNRPSIIRAIAPLIKLDETDNSFFTGTDGYEVSTTAMNKNDIFKEFVGEDIQKFKDRFKAVTETKNKINQLLQVVGRTSSASGITNALTRFFGDISFKEGGTIAQLAVLIGGTDTTDKDISLKRIEQIIKKVRGEGHSIYKDTLNLGLQESMIIFLAASMARAVDPSGRLSNQDFEVQMRRLGASGLFMAKETKVVMLKDVQSDFNKKFERIEMINNILTDTVGKGFTKRQVQILMANEKLNAILDGFTESLDEGETGVRDINEIYKGNKRYVPQLNQQGLPTGKYIDQKDPFGDLIDKSEFGTNI